MTPDEILAALELEPGEIEDIGRLTYALQSFEAALKERDHATQTAVRTTLDDCVKSCVQLIASMTGASIADVEVAAREIFDISESEWAHSKTTLSKTTYVSIILRKRAGYSAE